MDLPKRQALYRKIEEYRKRPLVVYATSTRPGVQARMAADAVREFVDQLDSIPAPNTSIDILLHSTGGDPLAAWKLMSMIRERFSDVTVLVPFMAFSAATLFALGANTIVMHPNSSLGPIDPQIIAQGPDSKKRQFAYEDLGAFLRFLGEEVGITEQVHLTQVVDKLLNVSDALTIGSARRASDLSSEVGERLLSMHMDQKGDKDKARQIALNLNKSFFAHGDAISRKRAKDLALNVAESDPGLESLIWEAYLGLEEYMELRTQFDPTQVFFADPARAESLRGTQPMNLPPDTPQQAAQQAWNALLTTAVQRARMPGQFAAYALVNAVVESVRVASEFGSAGTITAFRRPDGEINMQLVASQSGWKPVKAPEGDQG